MKVKTASASDVGRVRKENEDAVGLFEDLGLFIVADGMGGHAGGEIASRLAVAATREHFSGLRNLPLPKRLLESLSRANHDVFERSRQERKLAGMGTTIVTLALEDQEAYLAYAGDSRAYLIRSGEIEQLTTDHTLVGEYLREGLINQEEVARHPMRHVLTRALGTSETLETEIRPLALKEEDRLLLCTDGLTNMLDDRLILEVGSSTNDLDAAAALLIERANRAGGADNITVLLIQAG